MRIEIAAAGGVPAEERAHVVVEMELPKVTVAALTELPEWEEVAAGACGSPLMRSGGGGSAADEAVNGR